MKNIKKYAIAFTFIALPCFAMEVQQEESKQQSTGHEDTGTVKKTGSGSEYGWASRIRTGSRPPSPAPTIPSAAVADSAVGRLNQLDIYTARRKASRDHSRNSSQNQLPPAHPIKDKPASPTSPKAVVGSDSPVTASTSAKSNKDYSTYKDREPAVNELRAKQYKAAEEAVRPLSPSSALKLIAAQFKHLNAIDINQKKASADLLTLITMGKSIAELSEKIVLAAQTASTSPVSGASSDSDEHHSRVPVLDLSSSSRNKKTGGSSSPERAGTPRADADITDTLASVVSEQ